MNTRAAIPKHLSNPESAEAFDSRADWKYEHGDWRGAVEDYNAALEHEDHGFIRFFLYDLRAFAKFKLGDYQGMEDDLTVNIDRQRGYLSSPYYVRGEAKRELGDLEGACRDWRKALEALQKERDHALSQGYQKERESGWYEDACKRVSSLIEKHSPDRGAPGRTAISSHSTGSFGTSS